MRLGRERPRKVTVILNSRSEVYGFNEAGARTPQKARLAAADAAAAAASMRLGRERPRKFLPIASKAGANPTLQ